MVIPKRRKAMKSPRGGAKVPFCGLSLQTVFFLLLAAPSPAQTISPGGVVSGASFAAVPVPVAPGSIISVFGAALAVGAGAASATPLPTTLLGTQLLINGIAAPLFFVSPGQINAQMPWEVRGFSTVSVMAVVNGTLSNAVIVNLADAAPGIFQGAILDAVSGQLISPSNPARAGVTYLTIYCTGLGPVTNQPPTGAAAAIGVLSEALDSVAVTVGGVPATVSFSGLAPTFVGLYQINVQVPANVPFGDGVPVTLSGGGIASNAVTIAIVGSQPSGSIKFIQSANFTETGGATAAKYIATFSSSVTAGDLIVLAFWWNCPPGSKILSVADSGGNSYNQALVTPTGNDDNAWIYYATNMSTGPPLSVTVVVSQATADQFSIVALEYSGVHNLDVTSTNLGSLTSSSTTSNSGSALTHEADELIIGVSLSNELNATAGVGFTSRFASNYFMVEDKIVSSVGTYDAEFFLPTGCQFCIWTAGMATFH
jgi:uncharacterized protein (TIGR03437 family)